MKALYFDMDGTIANLYGVDNWLPMLRAENTYPYVHALPIGDLSNIINLCKQLKEHGYIIGVVSWGAKNATPAYNKRVRAAKVRWIKKYFNIVDEMHVVKYGTPKYQVVNIKDSVLFDDEQKNCDDWNCADSVSCHVSSLADIENFCYNLIQELAA